MTVSELTRTKSESTGVQAVADFRNELLKQTFDWCVKRSPFYARRFSDISVFRGLRDLHQLPVLHRAELVDNLQELLCDSGLPCCVQYTTGTTGAFTPLMRSYAEVHWIGQFFNARVMERHNPSEIRPLHLALTSAYHGAATPIPSWPYILSSGVYDRTQADQARRMIEREFSLPGVEARITGITGSDLLLRSLTAYLIDESVDLHATKVRTLVFTGGYVSAATKRRLGQLWNAQVFDRYSMSEVFGGAVQVTPDGPWTFDVEVVPEVVHPRTLQPIQHGVGALLMTSLYPFSQMTPVIRYYTGDLVEVEDGAFGSSSITAVRLCGRQRRSVIDDSGPEVIPLVLAGHLHEAIERLPDVAITPRFEGVASSESMEFVGKHHYMLASSAGQDGQVDRIEITLGLRYAPWIFPERSAAVVTELRRALYDRSPHLLERVSKERLHLEIGLTTADKVQPFSMK